MAFLRCLTTALCVVFVLGQAVYADAVWSTDLNEARREAERLHRPIVCHFGAKWCGPCKKMETTVFNQPNVIDQLKATAVCVKIDVDEHPELAQRFGVDRFPTDIIIDPTGQRLMESTGFQDATGYISLVDRASRRYSDLLAARQTKQPATNVTSSDVAGPAKPPMLEGYCPVTLQKVQEWTKGNPEFSAEHKGQQFLIANEQAWKEFQSKPEQFAPQFLGCDPVLLFTADRAVPGTVEWGAYYDKRLFLFSNEDNRRQFKADPEKYVRTQVVLNLEQIETVIR